MRSCIAVIAVVIGSTAFTPTCRRIARSSSLATSEWTGDFDEYVGDAQAEDQMLFTDDLFQSTTNSDRSACSSRQFSLGQDLVISDFVGNMGFEEVTDWEYYYESEDTDEKQVVRPNPLDPAQPKRTRAASGSVVRIFRGEFIGKLGATLRAKGMDNRLLIKEFTGKLALQLSRAELISVGTLQSAFCSSDNWFQAATSRSIASNKDDAHLSILLKELSRSNFVGIFGQVNLAELEGDWDPNEFYRALGVKPPASGAIWIVYEYAGLNSLEAYCVPPAMRQSPPKRGMFGNLVGPPALPKFSDRAAYIRAIMKQSLQAVANLHSSGISHRSIGRSSLIISSSAQDKREASSIYATSPNSLLMKLSDLGFSGAMNLATYDKDFVRRARAYGVVVTSKTNTEQVSRFSQAEDLHALGLVFLALLLTSLADTDTNTTMLPATDEDTLQRLVTDIFDKDMMKFREYVKAEPDIWDQVVNMLDERKGWDLLDSLLFAREEVAGSSSFKTAEDLLEESPFFK